MKPLVLVAHNIRSALNVGSIIRSAACFGVEEVVLSGYSPYPKLPKDPRLPHESAKADRMISKTALGAEKMVVARRVDDLTTYLAKRKNDGWSVIAVEQAKNSVPLEKVSFDQPTVLIVGNEVSGLERPILDLADGIAEIVMDGRKESLNVSVAAGIALYEWRRRGKT